MALLLGLVRVGLVHFGLVSRVAVVPAMPGGR